ncbi:MAG: carotenoid biosynthesis protein [Saprospiraceae bacterium]|nr:carotenoid biosynthesis protein [Saprospiraceae bacterium]
MAGSDTNTVAEETGWRAFTPAERRFMAIMVFLYASGLVAHAVPSLRPLTAFTADVFLLGINGVLLWFIFRRNADRRLWIWAAAAYLFTFAIEALGVATGAVFGAYTYGSGMKVQWLGVPLVIALNWTLLTLGVNDLAARLFRSPWLIASAAAVLMAAYDWFIEPVAIALDYWTWAGGNIPLQNYLAWAAVAFVASVPLHLFRIRFRHPLLPVYLGVQLLYFIVLQFLLV